MAKHIASVDWRLAAGADFISARYSRRHEWAFDGGAIVPASSSPSIVPIPMSDAEAVDPEEAFIAAIASCHMLFFLSLAGRARVEVTTYRDNAEGILHRSGSSMAFETIKLYPKITITRHSALDFVTLKALHVQAHEQCFLAKSVNFPILCDPEFSFDEC